MEKGGSSADYPRARRPEVRVVNAHDHHQRWLSNAANEVAVTQFLAGRLSFAGIADVIERTLDAHEQAEVTTLAAVRRVDEWARRYSLEASGKGTIETLRSS